MGRHRKDLTDERFGRLVVKRFVGTDERGNAIWLCKCDCGNWKRVRALSLGRDTNSCGCIKVEKNIERLAWARELKRIKRQANENLRSND